MNQIFSKRKQQLAMTGGHPSRKRMKSDTLSDDVVVGENVETELSTSNVCGSSIAENLSTSNPPGAVGDDLYKEGNDELGTSTSLHLPEYSGIMEHYYIEEDDDINLADSNYYFGIGTESLVVDGSSDDEMIDDFDLDTGAIDDNNGSNKDETSDHDHNEDDMEEEDSTTTSNESRVPVCFKDILSVIRDNDKYKTFSVMTDIDLLLSSILMEDELEQLGQIRTVVKRCDGADSDIVTVSEIIYNSLIHEQLNIKGRNSIIEAINVALGCSIPKFSYDNDRSHGRSSATQKMKPKRSFLKYPVCKNGDHVYVGEFSNDTKCPIKRCHHARANPCTQPECKNIPIDEVCNHGYQYRSHFRWVLYRPICLYLQKALAFDQFYKLINSDFSDVEINWDIMKKEVALQQMEAMKQVWNMQSHAVKSDCIPVYLLLGINYDGVKVFSRKTSNFNPLFVTVLNLPPFLRSKRGVGLWPLSVYDGVVGQDCSDSEEFLFTSCVVEELVELENGKIITVIDFKTGERKKFFVLVRIIHHGYDTRAFENILHIKSSNSYNWCFLCSGVIGSRMKEVGNTCFIGSRGGLKLRSILRRRGQSMACCPRGFYGDHSSHKRYGIPKIRLRKKTNKDDQLMPQSTSSRFLNYRDNKKSDLKRVDPCCAGNAHEDNVEAALLATAEWEHGDIVPIDQFDETIGIYFYAEHLDLRPVIPYTKTTNGEYYARGKACLNRKAAIKDPFSGRKNNFSCEGVKDVYSFAKLSYADIQLHLMWDPFHCFYNIALHIIELLKNERGTSTTVSNYCKKANIHPSIWNEKTKNKVSSTSSTTKEEIADDDIDEDKINCDEETPTIKAKNVAPVWALPTSVQTLLDNVIGALLIPVGCKNDFQIKNPFGATGNLNGIAKITLLTSLMDLITWVIHFSIPKYPHGYLYFMKIISSDITDLLSRGFSDTAVAKLLDRVKETAALFEGLFPPTEALITTHQMVDIAAHIQIAGPVKGWWTIAGERAVGAVAKKVIAGGALTYVRAFRSECEECDLLMKHELSNDVEIVGKAISDEAFRSGTSYLLSNAHKYMFFNDDSKTYDVQPAVSFLHTKYIIKNCTLSFKENIQLLDAFMNRLNVHANLIDGTLGLCETSFFYRLQLMLQTAKAKKSALYKLFCRKKSCSPMNYHCPGVSPDTIEFAQWIQYLRACIKELISNKSLRPRLFFRADCHSAKTVQSALRAENMLATDYSVMKKYHEMFSSLSLHEFCNFYRVASHCGTTFKGRYRSSTLNGSNNDISGTYDGYSVLERNIKSDEKLPWLSKIHHSSWCFVKSTLSGKNDDKSVGQISLFVAVTFDHDAVLSQTLWMHYVPHETISTFSQHTFYNALNCVSADQLVTGGMFVDFDRLIASSVAVLPIVLPTPVEPPGQIIPPKIFVSSLASVPPQQAAKYFTTQSESVSNLVLFPMDPSNKYCYV